MGVEEEFRGYLENTLNWYEKSVIVLKENDISNESLLKKFTHAYEAAKKVIMNHRCQQVNNIQKKFIASQLHRPRIQTPLTDSMRISHQPESSNGKRPLSASSEFKILTTDHRIRQQNAIPGKSPMTNILVRPPRDPASRFIFQNNRIVEMKGASGELDRSWNASKY